MNLNKFKFVWELRKNVTKKSVKFNQWRVDVKGRKLALQIDRKELLVEVIKRTFQYTIIDIIYCKNRDFVFTVYVLW